MARILIVEDDADIALALCLRLEAAGHEPHVASDAREALGRARELEPGFVLMDYSVPGGTGLEVAERLREAVPDPPPVLFLTAHKSPEVRARIESLGYACLEKPYDARKLLQHVQAALAGTPGGA